MRYHVKEKLLSPEVKELVYRATENKLNRLFGYDANSHLASWKNTVTMEMIDSLHAFMKLE